MPINEALIYNTDGTVTYQGSLRTNLDLEPDPIGKIFTCQLEVENPYEPITYEGDIVTHVNIDKEYSNHYILSSMEIKKQDLNQEIPFQLKVNPINQMYEFRGNTTLEDPKPTCYDILDSSVYYQQAKSETEIPCKMDVPYPLNTEFKAKMDIPAFWFTHFFDCTMEIDGISTSYELNGEVHVDAEYADAFIPGSFQFIRDKQTITLPGTMELELSTIGKFIPIQMKVRNRKFIYSIFSKMKVVPGYNKFIDCQMEVTNPYTYNVLTGSAFVNYDKSETGFNGELYNQPHLTKYIPGTTDLMKIGTYHDILNLIMSVVNFSDTFINCKMTVLTPYTRYGKDILNIKMNAGIESTTFISGSLYMDPSVVFTKEIPLSMEVQNPTIPARIGILVDPLWENSPFVLKSSLITFFKRCYQTHDISIVYGGQPISNWDIHKIAHIFRIPDENLNEVPFGYIPANPIANRDYVFNFIRQLTSFRDDERKEISKIFIFSDIAYTRHNTTLYPLIKFAMDSRIPCIIITSKGDFTETELLHAYPPGPEVGHPIWHGGFPPQHPGPFAFSPNEATKHKNVYDDRPIV